MKPNKPAKHYVLPLIAGGLSLLTLVDSYVYSNLPKIGVAIVGVLAAVLFFINNRHFLKVIKAWIVALFPVITCTENLGVQNGMEMVSESPIWDVTPIFGFNFSLGLGLQGGSLSLGVSLLPILLLILYRVLLANSVVGKSVVISKFRADNKLGDVFPMNGIISESLKIEGENYWYSIKLDSPLVYAGKSYPSLIVRDKGEEVYKPGKGKVSHMRLVESPEMLTNGTIKKGDYPFVDWGVVTLNK